MLLGIIKKYIADYDEELVKMSKVNEVLQHITTDLTYVSQDDLNADEDIIEDRVPPKVEKVIDGYSGFLFYDENDMPLVAMHWQHRFNHMVGTMIFTGCRCRISLLMCADTPIVPIWQNRG